jgi:ATP adenylyltransferase/5',5'''-P-1,P-4-tetraphosphate phosphorylase II
VLEGEFDGGDLGGIAVGEVGDVAFFDFAVLAEGFAEVDGLVGFTVGGGPAGAGYMHVHIIQHTIPLINRKHRLCSEIIHVYIFQAKIDVTASDRLVYLKMSG